jgi:hypothetical protein
MSSTVTLTFESAINIMRFVPQSACSENCPSNRVKIKPTSPCDHCSMICHGILSGHGSVDFVDHELLSPDIISCILTMRASDLLYEFESPVYGSPITTFCDVSLYQINHFN